MFVGEMPKQWKTIRFEELGASIPNADFEGLAGIEECHDYGIVSRKYAKREKKVRKKKKNDSPAGGPEAKKAKVTVVNGFTVTPMEANPSRSAKGQKRKKEKENDSVKVENSNEETAKSKSSVETQKDPEEKGENASLDQMEAWFNFGIPESILRGLADLGFTRPTAIQELTLPSAMHGRRDILGAAETGSGKTLAFGIPIISGILRLKEKESAEVSPAAPSKQTVIEDLNSKIINFNKLSSDERKKIMSSSRRTKITKQNYTIEDENVESDSEIDGDDSSDEDESNDESNDASVSEEESGNDTLSGDESENSDEETKKSAEEETESELDSISESELRDIHEESESGINSGNELNSDDNEEDESDEKKLPLLDYKSLYGLILTPTRELAIQIKNHLVLAAKHTDIRIAVVVGGMAQVKQERILSKCPEIVVATPGRLWEMIQQGNEHLSKVADISFLAIDETDRMIEHGHFEELHLLLDKINDNESKRIKRQNFVFSATLTMVHDLPFHLKTKRMSKKGKFIKKKIVKLTPEQKLKKVVELLGISNPKVVDVTKNNQGSSNTLTECRITCSITHKDYYLYYVLKRHPGRTIVFCNSIGCVKRLTQLFNILQCKPLPLHASMQQRQRLKNLDRFRDNELGLLIATDVAARGLDIPNVEHVIHYQVPRTAENYVHRSGRTARATKEGITILIMEPGEVQNYTRMCRTLSKTEDLPHFPVLEAFLSATKQRVDLARDIDLLEFKMKKHNSEVGWYEKTMREMDIILDEREMPQKVEKDVAAEQKSALASKKKQLNKLISSHLFPKGFSFKYPSSNSNATDNLVFGKPQNAIEAMKSALNVGHAKKKTTRNDLSLNEVNNYQNLKHILKASDKKERKWKKNKIKKLKRKM